MSVKQCYQPGEGKIVLSFMVTDFCCNMVSSAIKMIFPEDHNYCLNNKQNCQKIGNK